MENLEGNLKSDSTIKVFIAIGIIFSAINGMITLIKFLEEKEIARKKLIEQRKS